MRHVCQTLGYRTSSFTSKQSQAPGEPQSWGEDEGLCWTRVDEGDLVQSQKGSRELLKARDPKKRPPGGEGHTQEACKVTGEESTGQAQALHVGKAGRQRTSRRRGKGGQELDRGRATVSRRLGPGI